MFISSNTAPRYSILQRGISSSPCGLRDGILAPVGFEITDHDVDAALHQFVRVRQHLIGFSDAGGKAQVDLQPAAFVEGVSMVSSQRSAFRSQPTAIESQQTIARPNPARTPITDRRKLTALAFMRKHAHVDPFGGADQPIQGPAQKAIPPVHRGWDGRQKSG